MNRRLDEKYTRTPGCYLFSDCVDTSRIIITPKFSLDSNGLPFHDSIIPMDHWFHLLFMQDHQQAEAIDFINLSLP